MIEYFIIIIALILALVKRKEYLIYSLVLVLPFHNFVKAIFTTFTGGGEVFALWKEIFVIMILVKSFENGKLKVSQTLFIRILFFFIVVLLYGITSPHAFESLPKLRDHIFPIILFISIASTTLEKVILKKVVLFICISATLSCLMGFLQFFFLNIQIATIMNNVDFIDAAGFVQYRTTSFRIMGFERMFGIMGGPNTLGIYLSLIVVFIVGVIQNFRNFLFSRFHEKLIRATLILAIICLVLTFSRAGWAVSILGSLLISKFNKIKIFSKTFIQVGFVVVIFVFITLIQYPYIFEVIQNSVSGKELSAADRKNNVSQALEINLEQPWGHGLGTSDNRLSDNKFFAESAFMNIFYEIGLIGLLSLFTIHLYLLNLYSSNLKLFDGSFTKISLALTIPALLISFVSINTYENPFIYLWWLVLGLGVNEIVSVRRKSVDFRNK